MPPMADPDRALTRRTVTIEDRDAVFALVAASDTATLGLVDVTVDDVVADLRNATMQRFGWYDGRGALVGYGWVERTEDSNQTEIDLYVHPDHDPALGLAILAHLEHRAQELVAEVGHPQPWLGTGLYRQDTRSQEWLRTAGYEVRTTFARMRIDLDPAAASTPAMASTPADGSDPQRRLQLRACDPSQEGELRLAHRLVEESMAGHYGHVAESFATWSRRLTERGPDYAEVHLGELDGEPVGVLVGTRQFESDQNAGYVRTLGVLPAARGHGVAKALLRNYLACAARHGRSAVLLHVDVANLTGALRIYESVGMRAALMVDAWAKGERTG